MALLATWAFVTSCSLNQAAEFDQAHTSFGLVLTRFVSGGRVDYAALKSQRTDLDAYLDHVASVGRESFQSWTTNQQLALLLNVYNAATLQLIVDRYPVKSIKDVGGVLSGPWDQKIVRLFGETLTLNHLEHQLIRQQFPDPRIHFALVCAANGCPPLRDEPYVGANLSEQLDDQARRFLANVTKNRIVPDEKTVWLSPIFKWYRTDFERQGGSVLGSVEPFWPATNASQAQDFRIRYTDYDWSLNATNLLPRRQPQTP